MAPPNSNGTNPHQTTEDPQSKVIKSPAKETGNTWEIQAVHLEMIITHGTIHQIQ